MELCHLKHSELSIEQQSYKGGVVFRGDNVRDQEGYLAVFSEQGSSASHMAAAKFLDAISRFNRNDGEDADALGAYTQSDLIGCDIPETWVRLPKHQWPKEWHGKYTEPVVQLVKSLYGHPLAGLLWEKHCRKKILQCGFEPIPGWECPFVHKKSSFSFLCMWTILKWLAERKTSNPCGKH